MCYIAQKINKCLALSLFLFSFSRQLSSLQMDVTHLGFSFTSSGATFSYAVIWGKAYCDTILSILSSQLELWHFSFSLKILIRAFIFFISYSKYVLIWLIFSLRLPLYSCKQETQYCWTDTAWFLYWWLSSWHCKGISQQYFVSWL